MTYDAFNLINILLLNTLEIILQSCKKINWETIEIYREKT